MLRIVSNLLGHDTEYLPVMDHILSKKERMRWLSKGILSKEPIIAIVENASMDENEN